MCPLNKFLSLHLSKILHQQPNTRRSFVKLLALRKWAQHYELKCNFSFLQAVKECSSQLEPSSSIQVLRRAQKYKCILFVLLFGGGESEWGRKKLICTRHNLNKNRYTFFPKKQTPSKDCRLKIYPRLGQRNNNNMSTLPFLLSVADELDNINSQSYMDDFGLGGCHINVFINRGCFLWGGGRYGSLVMNKIFLIAK